MLLGELSSAVRCGRCLVKRLVVRSKRSSDRYDAPQFRGHKRRSRKLEGRNCERAPERDLECDAQAGRRRRFPRPAVFGSTRPDSKPIARNVRRPQPFHALEDGNRPAIMYKLLMRPRIVRGHLSEARSDVTLLNGSLHLVKDTPVAKRARVNVVV